MLDIEAVIRVVELFEEGQNANDKVRSVKIIRWWVLGRVLRIKDEHCLRSKLRSECLKQPVNKTLTGSFERACLIVRADFLGSPPEIVSIDQKER